MAALSGKLEGPSEKEEVRKAVDPRDIVIRSRKHNAMKTDPGVQKMTTLRVKYIIK